MVALIELKGSSAGSLDCARDDSAGDVVNPRLRDKRGRGRPRLPDAEVTPGALRRRESYARLRLLKASGLFYQPGLRRLRVKKLRDEEDLIEASWLKPMLSQDEVRFCGFKEDHGFFAEELKAEIDVAIAGFWARRGMAEPVVGVQSLDF